LKSEVLNKNELPILAETRINHANALAVRAPGNPN